MPKGDITLPGRVRTPLRVPAAINAGETRAAAISAASRAGCRRRTRPASSSRAATTATPGPTRCISPARRCASRPRKAATSTSSARAPRRCGSPRGCGPGAGRLSHSLERTATAADPVRAGHVRHIIRTRFVRVWQLLLATGLPFVAPDADSLVRRPLTALADAAHHGPQLATDMMVLHQVRQRHLRHLPGFRVPWLGHEHSDPTFRDASLVWHAESVRKSPTSAFDRLAAGEPLETVLGTGHLPPEAHPPAAAAIVPASGRPAGAANERAIR